MLFLEDWKLTSVGVDVGIDERELLAASLMLWLAEGSYRSARHYSLMMQLVA